MLSRVRGVNANQVLWKGAPLSYKEYIEGIQGGDNSARAGQDDCSGASAK